MVRDEIEQQLLEGSISMEPYKLVKTLKYLPVDHLSASLICRNIPLNDKYIYDHKDKVLTFELYDINSDNLTNTEKIRLAEYKGVMDYINNLNITPGLITKRFNSIVKDLDLNDREKDVVIDAFHEMNEICDFISDNVYNSLGAISSERIFFSYGKKPRLTYSSTIDLILAFEDGVDVYILTPNTNGGLYNASSMSNIRLLSIIKHFCDIGIKVKKYHEIVIPFNEGTKLRINKIGHNEVSIKYANRFFDLDVMPNSNLSYCRSCIYNSVCKLDDMFPIIPIR